MSNAQRLIPFAFGAVVVLLAANLVVGTWRPAEAGVASGPTEPYVVQLAITPPTFTDKPLSMDRMYRLWSDGAVDMWGVRADPTQTGEYDTVWWGWVPLDPVQRADLNADGCVDAFDLNILLADWWSVAGGNPCGTCGT